MGGANAVVLVALGFPIALVIAWAFELTPEGIKRTGDLEQRRRTAVQESRLNFVVIIAGAMSAGLFFLGRFTAPERGDRSGAATEIHRRAATG